MSNRHTPTRPSGPPVRVRLSGAQGLVAAVPPCLGFEPHESIVLLCLSGPNGRVGPVARVDLFPPGSAGPVRELLSCARRYAERVAILAYHDGPRPDCLDGLLARFRGGGIEVIAALSVRRGLVRDTSSAAVFDRDPGVAVLPPDDDQVCTLAASSAMAGRRVLPSRQALAASIAAPVGARDEAARDAILRAQVALARDLAAAGTALTLPLSRLVDEILDRAYLDYSTSGAVAPDTAASLIVLSAHIGCRDQMLGRAVSARSGDVVSLLISVAAQCPQRFAADLCAVLAAAAYRFGDGALAHCALDRVLAVSPDHRLARLLSAAIGGGLPPAEFAALADIDVPADVDRL